MLRIDGSHGEGGGQILRYAIALSIITKTPILIHDIRANRSNPGLRPQHFTVLSLLKQISNATVTGLTVGSSTVTFKPGTVKGGTYDISIGTAGSITLVLQACLLSGLVTKTSIDLQVSGGTDVQWSPSWDYFTHVFQPVLHSMNISCEATLHRRGYYPKGGGKAHLHINPIHSINPIQFTDDESTLRIEGIVHAANLPDHIPRRLKHAALQPFVKENIPATITTDITSSPSPGVGITLWMRSPQRTLGATQLGKKGLPAETIAQNTTETLLTEYHTGATMDPYLFDQLIPYMALANGTSICRVSTINAHAETTLWLLNQFYQKKIARITKEPDHTIIQITGLNTVRKDD
jgi:RNA 3'-phosphate cyclase